MKSADEVQGKLQWIVESVAHKAKEPIRVCD